MAGFNNDKFLKAEVSRLSEEWQVSIAVETGTNRGSTTLDLAALCELVHTIELNEARFKQSSERLAEHHNVEVHHGSSPDIMRTLDVKDQRILFYLDAHGNDYSPILDELKEISRLQIPEPVIVIHDFAVPDRPNFGFDSYGGQALDIDFVSDGLMQIYGSDLRLSYNRKAGGARRGVLFVEPSE